MVDRGAGPGGACLVRRSRAATPMTASAATGRMAQQWAEGRATDPANRLLRQWVGEDGPGGEVDVAVSTRSCCARSQKSGIVAATELRSETRSATSCPKVNV